MNAQEIFDKVATHLIVQGERSINDHIAGGCAYRGVGGMSCAVGCLIPDKAYKQSMEGTTAGAIIEQYPSLKWMVKHKQLLSSLQGVHDNHTPMEWRQKLIERAEVFRLDTKALQFAIRRPAIGVTG